MSRLLMKKGEFFFPNLTYGTQPKSDGDKNATKLCMVSLCRLLGYYCCLFIRKHNFLKNAENTQFLATSPTLCFPPVQLLVVR